MKSSRSAGLRLAPLASDTALCRGLPLSVDAGDGCQESAGDCGAGGRVHAHGYEARTPPTQRHVHVDGARRERADGHGSADRVDARVNDSR